MFSKENRYVTRRVNEKVDLLLQLLLWNLIDKLNIEKDYLQVFKLNKVGDIINIEHSQEIPEYKSYIKVSSKELCFEGEAKLYAIDCIEYSTLLLAEEY